jgi:hypothetical protein
MVIATNVPSNLQHNQEDHPSLQMHQSPSPRPRN